MWLPVCSLVSRVNYHVATVDDRFFRCRNNGFSRCEHPSTHVPALPLRSLVLPGPPTFPCFFRTGSSCFMPCSPLPDLVSISKLFSLMSPDLYHLITVCTVHYILVSHVFSLPLLITTVVVPACCQVLLTVHLQNGFYKAFNEICGF